MYFVKAITSLTIFLHVQKALKYIHLEGVFFNIVRFNDNDAAYIQQCEQKHNCSKKHLYLFIYLFFHVALVNDFDWLLKTILWS